MMERSTLRGLLGAVACVLLAACSSKAERIESGLRKGADYVRASDWEKASIEVRNVLQIDPKSARAYFVAGQIDDGRAAFRNAYANYAKAVELKPDFIEAKIGLARIYLLAGDVPHARGNVSDVLATQPDNTSAQALNIAVIAREGRSDEALAAASKLTASGASLTAESSLLLAGLYVNAKDHDAALGVLDKAIAADAGNVKLLQMAAEVAGDPRSEHVLPERAVRYYKAAVAASPKDAGLWKAWALYHVRRSETAAAEAVLRESIRVQPDDGSRVLALLDLSSAFRDPAATEKEFQSTISKRPKDTELRFALVRFYNARNRPDDARRVLEETVALGKDTPAGLSARGELARLSLVAGRTEEARSAVNAILKISPRDGAALLLRGRMLLADDKPRDAVIDLRAAAKDRPGSFEVATLLAAAHRASGEPQLARDVLEDAVKFKPDDAQLHLLLAGEMAGAKDYKAAQSEVAVAMRLAPQNIRAFEMKVELANASGDVAAAEKAALDVQSRFPQSPVGFLQLGRVYAAQRKLDAAMAQYDAAARIVPNAVEPVILAVSVLASQRKYAEIDKRIDALQASQPASAAPHELRAEIALGKGDLAAAEESFRKVVGVAPASASAYRNLASVMVGRKNLPGALAVLDDAEKAHPKDVMLPTARAQWLARAGRYDDAIAIYQRVLERAPQADEAANNLAYLLTQAKGDKASLDRALQIAARFDTSPNPAFAGTLGLVRYRLGQYDQAADILQRAVALAPNEAILQLHYGMALYKKGDVVRAKEYLRKAVDSNVAMPNLAEGKSLLAAG